MSGFNINSISLSGTLTRDPELKDFSTTSLCSMRLAYNTRRKNSDTGEWTDEPNFIDLVAWGGIGTWYANNLSRGSQVVVHGELRWREWEAQDGSKRQSYQVNVDSLVPVERSGNGGGQARSDVPSDGSEFTHATAGAPADDDIPFKWNETSDWEFYKGTWRA